MYIQSDHCVDVPQVQKQLKNALVKIFPTDRAKVDTFLSLGQSIMSATTIRQLMDSAFRSMRVCMGVVREWGVATEDYVGVVPTEGQVSRRIPFPSPTFSEKSSLFSMNTFCTGSGRKLARSVTKQIQRYMQA